MKKSLVLAVCALSTAIISGSVYAYSGSGMARAMRSSYGISVTRLVTPYYTSCSSDVYKDEKGSLSITGSHGSRCVTHKGNIDPRGMLRDRH